MNIREAHEKFATDAQCLGIHRETALPIAWFDALPAATRTSGDMTN
jgi:hypothetical protein